MVTREGRRGVASTCQLRRIWVHEVGGNVIKYPSMATNHTKVNGDTGSAKRPHVILIGGPNGAGKSTSAPEILQGSLQVQEFVNADVIAHGFSAFQPEKTTMQAGRIMLSRIRELASQKVSFAFETTLRLLMAQKQLLASPIQEWPVIKKTTSKPETIDRYSSVEIAKIKEYFKDRPEYDYLLMLIYTGCRRSEIWGITKADVKTEENSIRIQNFKTGTNVANQFRFIEIHSELLPVLLKHCAGKKSTDILFPKKGSGNWLMNAVFKACKKLEITYRRLHGFRHTFISNLLLAGVPPRIVMTMAGHTNLATTLRYSHINLSDVKGKIKNLGY